MTSPARRERSALCDTFETVGPGTADPVLPVADPGPGGAPGDPGGTPRRGARHVRAAAGRALPTGAGRLRGGALARAGGAGAHRSARRGPRPGSNRWTTVVNLAEMFLHHEDVLRAAARLGAAAAPRRPRAGLWSVLTRTGRLLFRALPAVGVVLVTPTYGRRLVRTPPSGARLRRAAGHPRRAAPARLGTGSASRGSRSRGPRTHAQPSRTPTSASDR